MNTQQEGNSIVKAPIQGLDEEKYRGQWLVVNGSTGQIAIAGNKLAEVQEKAKDQAIEHPVYYKVPTSDIHYVAIK